MRYDHPVAIGRSGLGAEVARRSPVIVGSAVSARHAAGIAPPKCSPWASGHSSAARNERWSGLDPLGDRDHAQRVAERDHGAHDRARLRIVRDLAQERAVDLEHVDRHVAQARQRRPSRPEVVDGELEAEPAELAQQRADPVGLPQGGGLGELHGQRIRRQVVGLQPAAQLVDEVRPVQLARRDVEADARVEPGVAPFAHLAADGVDHPVADRLEQAHLLGVGDELVGQDEPAVRVVPAQQRLDRVDPLGRHPHDWLVVQLELVLGDRPPQARGQRQALERIVVAEAVVDGRRRAPAALALVHRGVGVAQQRARAVGVVGEQRDPHAGLHVELGARHREGLGEPSRDVLGGRAGAALGLGAEVAEEHEELVAAVAREQPVRALDPAQARGDPAQQAVAGRVAQRVVDELEVVEIDGEQRHGLVAPAGARRRRPSAAPRAGCGSAGR